MQYKDIKIETGINIVCLIISAGAPAVAIGPVVGIPTGAAIALGLAAVIRAQRSAAAQVRSTYYVGALVIRIFSGAFEVMAYTDVFQQRSTLPFDLSPTVWAWATALFMAALDLWALQATAASAAAAADAAAEAESIARMERIENERRAAEAARAKEEHGTAIRLAEIQAETERAKAETEARKQAEIARKEAETRAEIERQRAETERKQAEERRKEAEIKAEAERQRAEERRKEAESEAEARRKEQEAKRQREEAERARAEAQRIENERIERERLERERTEAEAKRKEAETKNALAGKWAEASAEERKALIKQAEAEAERRLGRKPKQTDIAELLGTTDRTLRNYSHQKAA